MRIRTRKLIGTVALLAFLGGYAMAVMLLAVVLQVSSSKLVELAFYVVGGLAWVVPAALLVSWMQRIDPAPTGPATGDPAPTRPAPSSRG